MKNFPFRLPLLMVPWIFSFFSVLTGQLPVPIAYVDPATLEVNRILDRFEDHSFNGAISLQITEIAVEMPVGYVNVIVDFNQDMVIAPFPAPTGDLQEEWVVQNVPLPMTEEIFTEPRVDIWFPLQPLDFTPGALFNCAILISDVPFTLPQPFPIEIIPPQLTAVQVPITVFSWGANDLNGQEGDASMIIDPVLILPISIPIYEIEGPNDPDGMPDIGQQTNECGPTSAANSLIWLAKKHGFADKLPKDQNGAIDTDKLIRDLMKAMTGSDARPFDGLSGDQLKEGKEKYIEDNNLPLVVKGGMNDPASSNANSLNFIISELNDGEDVEMLVDWPGPGSHWVTVTGYGIGLGGPVIYVHDPDDGRTGKTVWTLQITQNFEFTGRFISPANCPIMWAVSESYEPSSTQSRSSMIDELRAFPNPLQGYTTIHYALRNAAEVRLTLQDAKGSVIRVLENAYKTGGLHAVPLSASDLPSGVYFCTLAVGQEQMTIELVVE